MLPTFRVRDLRRPRSPGSGRPLMAGPQKSIYDGTVRISAPEYDTTLSDHPEANLKYVDEDDGDIITVGSSLELAQRLGEPVVSSKLRSHYNSVVKPLCPAGSEHSVNSSMHTFDIYCQGNSLKVWQEIEQRSKQIDVGKVTLGEIRGLERGKVPGLDMQLSLPLPESERAALVTAPFVRTEYGKPTTNSRPCEQPLRFVHDLERSASTMTPFEYTNYAEPVTHSQYCKQPSLLQVFEAELAGVAMNQNSLNDTKQATAGQPGSPSTRSRDVMELPGSSCGYASVKTSGDLDSHPVNSFVNGIVPLSLAPPNEHLPSTSPPVQLEPTLDIGLRTVLKSFGTCVHNIADVIQNALTTSHGAESTKAVESQFFNDAVQGLRGAAEAIASLGQIFLEKNSAIVVKNVVQGLSQTTSSPTKDKGQPCAVMLWPMPDIAASVQNAKVASDIEDMLRLSIKDTVKILVSPEKDWSSRIVFITVESKEVAIRVCRHMSCREYHGRCLNAVIVSTPATGGSDAAILKIKLSDILPSRTHSFPRDNASKRSKSIKAEGKNTEVASQENLELNTALESQGNAGNDNSDRVYIANKHATSSIESLPTSHSHSSESIMSRRKTRICQSPLRCNPIAQCYWESLSLNHERSRSPSRENSDRDLPPRRGSPYRPRFHRPGPIHLPKDEVEVSNTDCALPLSSDDRDYKDAFSPYSQGWSARFSNRVARENHTSDPAGACRMTEKLGIRTNTLSGIPKSAFSPSRLPQAQHHAQDSPRMSPYANPATPGMFKKTRTSRGRPGMNTYIRRYPTNEPIFEPSNSFMPLKDKPEDNRLPVFAPNSETRCQATCDRETRSSPGYQGGLPSLTTPKIQEIQKCNGGSQHDVLVVTPSGATYSTPDIEAPIRSTSSTPTASRFPTLEQFEGRGFTDSSNFPPLPSMEPLTPQRPCHKVEVRKPQKMDDTAFPLVQAVESATLNGCSPSLGRRPASSDTDESSGDFFYRMTGLTEEAAGLAEPRSTLIRREGLSDVVKHLAVDGIKRHATVAGSTNSYVAKSRRPYSQNFSGNGRLPWETFLSNDTSVLKGDSSCQDPPSINSHPSTSVTHKMGKASAPSPVEAVALVSKDNSSGEHNDSATVAKIQECVEKLKDLGFGGDSDGGVKRLVVYAQAAEGNLSDAIDLIDEEQRAYHQWSY